VAADEAILEKTDKIKNKYSFEKQKRISGKYSAKKKQCSGCQ
jgi:hypothetical protein